MSRRPAPPDPRLLSIIHGARSRVRRRKKGRGTARAAYDLDEPENLRRLGTRFATGVCEVTGLPFNLRAQKTRRWNSPSIDRIDSARGYTYDNVRFVLWAINAAFADWGEQVFALIATAWLHQRAKRESDAAAAATT